MNNIPLLHRLEEINRLSREALSALIAAADGRYAFQLDAAAEWIGASADERHIVLFSGPSASGKTTSARLISQRLSERGLTPQIISLDNFYRGFGCAPRMEDGSFDYESVYALDLEQMISCIGTLLGTGEASFPVFDFHTARPSGERMQVRIGEKDVLILEGIHALHPLLLENLPAGRLVKLYVENSAAFEDESGLLLSPRDIRLCRRMLRDYRTRSASPELTMTMWRQVVRSEDRTLSLVRAAADRQLDSFHSFEPGLYRTIVSPLMAQLGQEHESAADLRRITEALARFVPIPPEQIGKASLIREFLGG